MLGKVGGRKADPDELDESTRYQLKAGRVWESGAWTTQLSHRPRVTWAQAILQFLQEKEFIETLVALESETGLKYVDSWRFIRKFGV